MSDEPIYTSSADDVATEADSKPVVPVLSQLALLSFILLLIFSVGYLPRFFTKPATVSETIPAVELEDLPASNSTDGAENPFADIAIRGQAAFVFDASKERVLFEKNPDEQLPIASITKLMTALVATELVQGGTRIPITMSAILQDGSSGLIDGEEFALETLNDLTLMASSNDGAYALAAAAGALLQPTATEAANPFIQAMNIRAEELGLTQTYYRNPTGLDISTSEAGAYSSARDVSFLMEYIIEHHPSLLESTTKPRAAIYNEAGAYHTAENTNDAIDQIAGLIGSKTGFTDLAGGTLTIAFDAAPNRPIIVTVLGSSFQARFSDVVALSEAARQAVLTQ